MKSISVILPTFNEAENITRLAGDLLRVISPVCAPELLILDDNSPDGTFETAARHFAGDGRVRVIQRRPDERGLARSIREGIDLATGEYLLVMDTDLTHQPCEVPRLLAVAPHFDLVSGSRFCAGGRMDDVKHYLASFTYNLFIRVILRTQVQDNLGGFWVGRTELVRQMPLDETFFGYGDYFFRLLFFVQRSGYTVLEVPSHYRERAAGRSKSNFFRLLFSYSLQVLRFRLQIRGREFPPRRTQ